MLILGRINCGGRRDRGAELLLLLLLLLLTLQFEDLDDGAIDADNAFDDDDDGDDDDDVDDGIID